MSEFKESHRGPRADQHPGDDRRLDQRRLDYDRAVDAAKAALVRRGIDSSEFARAAEASAQARQALDEIGRLDNPGDA